MVTHQPMKTWSSIPVLSLAAADSVPARGNRAGRADGFTGPQPNSAHLPDIAPAVPTTTNTGPATARLPSHPRPRRLEPDEASRLHSLVAMRAGERRY